MISATLSPLEKQRVRWLFSICLLARLAAIAVLAVVAYHFKVELSRDAMKYHLVGRQVAFDLHLGNFDWSELIDNGWFQFTGIMYYIFGPQPMVIQVVNAFLASGAAVLVYRIARQVYENDRVATLAAYVFGLFPSTVYYTSIPLKEAPAIASLLLLAYALVRLKAGGDLRYAFYGLAALAFLLALRDYLCLICLGLAVMCLTPVGNRGGMSEFLKLVISGAMCVLIVLGLIWGFQIEMTETNTLRYFDMEYINHVREEMTKAGGSRMFDDPAQAAWGQGFWQDSQNAAKAVLYFIFSIDPTGINSYRQFLAVPELLFFAYCVPTLVRGVWSTWRIRLHLGVVVLLFAVVLMGVYGAAATNAGAMYRWRSQALPFILMMLFYGAHLRKKTFLYRWLRLTRTGLPQPAVSLPRPAGATA